MTDLNHRHIKTLYDDYDVFLFDLWGVIVEGRVAYPGVVEQINDLIKQRKVFFVSNAPRPNYKVLQTLRGFGLESINKDMIITSGDVARNVVAESKITLGKGDEIAVYHLGSDRNDEILHDIPHKNTKSLDDADILLLTLYRDDHEDLNEFDDILEEAAKRNIITICANPDTTIPKQNTLRYCAGHFAEKIEKHGGNVIYTGKPRNEIYNKVFSYIPDVPKSRILMIGDTFETDILGAQNSGINSALVLTGNSQRHHGHVSDLDHKLELIKKAAEEQNTVPTIVTSIA